eukprot:3709908-Alexandrium_andersonii.AAC.1
MLGVSGGAHQIHSVSLSVGFPAAACDVLQLLAASCSVPQLPAVSFSSLLFPPLVSGGKGPSLCAQSAGFRLDHAASPW